MIKNERQYKITRAQLERFRGALEELRSRPVPDEDVLRHNLEVTAVESEAQVLAAQVDEYDRLKSGREQVGRLESLDDLPRYLIRSRIAAGLTQKELAGRLEMAEQQVQRYEANDWGSVSLTRLLEVARAIGVSTRTGPTEELPERWPKSRELRHRLSTAGLDAAFIDRRLTPPDGDDEEGKVLDLAARVHRIYGWAPSDVIAGKDLEAALPAAVGFKIPGGASAPRLRAYAVYAHYLAQLALEATRNLEQRVIPTPADSFRAALLDRFGEVSFSSILEFAWDLGIVVLPLSDPGAYHAVVWRDAGRNCIVLKQQTRKSSRWAFDLLHEIDHAAEQPEDPDYIVIDEETAPTDDAEYRANRFAGDVLLDGRAEALTAQCVEKARGRLQLLKSVVPEVAHRGGVSVADLANCLAFRLSMQGENWWGAATNLQEGDQDPWEVTREVLLRRADLRALSPLDRGLMVQALAE